MLECIAEYLKDVPSRQGSYCLWPQAGDRAQSSPVSLYRKAATEEERKKLLEAILEITAPQGQQKPPK
jgi:hypothetical protein